MRIPNRLKNIIGVILAVYTRITLQMEEFYVKFQTTFINHFNRKDLVHNQLTIDK